MTNRWIILVSLSVIASLIYIIITIEWSNTSQNDYNTSNDTSNEKLLSILSSCLDYREDNERIPVEEATKFLENRDENRDAIFFTETTGTGIVKGRFVCALESAAKAYPHADIYLLVTYFKTMWSDLNEPLRTVLRHHPNIKVLKVDLKKMFANSELETIAEKLERSKFKASHTSDVLRLFAIWKYGGAYMDLDIITVKSLTGIKNYLITELDSPGCYLAAGFFAFQKNFSLGPIMFKDMVDHFDGTDWYANGPRIWTNNILRLANVSRVGDINSTTLQGFTKLNYNDLFPIDYDKLDWYFNEEHTEKVLLKIKERPSLFGIHIGNNISKDNKVKVGSHQAYSFIAQTYCPRSYWSCYEQF